MTAVKNRQSYSVEYKIAIAEESGVQNLTVFCKAKNLDIRMVRRWRAAYEELCKEADEGNAKSRKRGSGNHPKYPELEDVIYDMIVDKRADKLVVCRAGIQKMALQVAESMGIGIESFKASNCWLDGFMERFELSLRRATTLFKLEDSDIVTRALAYKSFIDAIDFGSYLPANMIAMDETAVNLGQSSRTTIDFKGASSISIPSTGYESARVTCVLAIRFDGTKVPPLIILKGKADRMSFHDGVHIFETEKAWSTQQAIRKWVEMTLPLLQRGRQRGLLVWDSASTHRAKDMKLHLARRRIDQVMIPAGMTPYLQSLDIAVNKPFKDYLAAEVNDYIANRMVRNVRNNFVKPGLSEIVSWVKNAWNKVTDATIENALRSAYLVEGMPFDDTFVGKHARLGPLILERMNNAEDEAPASESEFFDIPEEDDATIFE
jgi:DDE superfamily endonuclease/Tc5 transposase DNA-binding domain